MRDWRSPAAGRWLWPPGPTSGHEPGQSNELKVCFEHRGRSEGRELHPRRGVLSKSGDRFSARLARRIEEDMLAAEFHYQISVVLLTANGVPGTSVTA